MDLRSSVRIRETFLRLCMVVCGAVAVFQPAPVVLAQTGAPSLQKARLHEAMGYAAQAKARRGDWPSVVRLLEAYPWEESIDPALLALYVTSLVETRAALPGRFLQASIPREAQDYAVGLYALSSGQLRKAKATFVSLTGGTVHGYLGWFGLALYAEALGNPQIMRDALSSIARNSHYTRSIGQAQLRELRISLNEMQGRPAEVERLLEEDRQSPIEDRLDAPMHMQYRINNALYRDRFSEARRLLDEYVRLFGEDEAAILLRSSLIHLTRGPSAELQYIQKKSVEHPQLPHVRSRLALAMLDNGRDAAAAEHIRQLLGERPFDLSSKQVFADIANVFALDSHSLDRMRSWFPEAEDCPQLNARLALAEYFSARDPARGMALLKTAESQFPSSRDVLSAGHIIARDGGRLAESRKWLERYAAAYPNEIGGRLLLMDVLYELGDAKEAREVAKALQKSKRWISAADRKRVTAIGMAEKAPPRS